MLSNANRAFASALAAALANLGLTHACISPGSRNTPLTLAFAERDDIESSIHHDERSAGFFALGLARASARPVALVCTSGTAATEYFPAVTEAAQSRVPLLVLTADRPPELRDVGAPQAIDQIKLYGDKVKWFHQGMPPDETNIRSAPSLAAHAWGAALDVPAGPVHLNLPFREPLAAAAGKPAVPQPATPVVRFGQATPQQRDVSDLAAAVDGRRTMFVVGATPPGASSAIAWLAARTGSVVFADPQSGLRTGPDYEHVVAHSDVLAAAGALASSPPDIVVRWGALPTSKATWQWLTDHPQVPQVLVDAGGHRDPLQSSRTILRADPGAVAAAVPETNPAPAGWSATWRDYGATAAEAISALLADVPFPNEPEIARTVVAAAPPHTALFVGSSMPIRDVDAFAHPRAAPLTIHANRGANGIDGSISTAAGVAATGQPVVALIGDIAALHDVGALATVSRLGLPLTIVVVHNDGGGIFSLLPQADPSIVAPAIFERTFGTPHGTDFVAVASAFGIPAHNITARVDLAEIVAAADGGPRLVELTTDRSSIAPLRRRLVEAVRLAIR